MGWRWTVVLLLAVSFGLAGCGNEAPPDAQTTKDFAAERQALAEKAAKRKNQASKRRAQVDDQEEAGPALTEAEAGYAEGKRDYFYDPRDKRDPFRSYRFADDSGPKKSFGPLGDFELQQLELSAVIWDATNPRALILDPGGRAYIVQEGSMIGKNNGHVIHIGDNLVLVKETYENFAGEQTTKDVELRIRLSQGG